MKRPLPLIPRGPRRRRPARQRLMLACPRVSPEWELGMLHVLMKPKPQTRGVVEHREGNQVWTAEASATLDDVLAVVGERLGLTAELHRPEAGEYHFLIEYTPAQADDVRALALLLSRRLPELWFVLDRLFVYGGVFHRRQYGYKLNLVPASNVHLPRATRAALRGLL